MACNSGACSAVTTALTRQVKICVEQGAVASVCHAAWSRLQKFKAVVQLLRQSLVEGEVISQEAALRPVLQQVTLSHIYDRQTFHAVILDSQCIAARQEYWNSKLQQLQLQRDLVRQNAENSIQVAQQSFSPEVLLATQHNKPSSLCLHMQRKVASARSSCSFHIARKLEEEMRIMLV
jgi:hypothetical protein